MARVNRGPFSFCEPNATPGGLVPTISKRSSRAMKVAQSATGSRALVTWYF
jgi:hypothetical protein